MTIEYAAPRPQRDQRLRKYIISCLTAPLMYVLAYAILRTGPWSTAFYNQGGWEIHTQLGARAELVFVPLMLAEAQAWYRLVPAPSGG